jgi:uncharacterized membrane protein
MRTLADLVVVAFDNASGADQVRDAMVQMQKDHIVTLEDAAVVVRKADGKVKVKQATSLVGAGAMGGAFWGMLIGLLFLAPWLGLAIGALSGALGGKFADIGVDDQFIKEVGGTIQPGHSALFLLIREATPDRLLEELQPYKGTVLKTSLSKENEAALKATFGAEE